MSLKNLLLLFLVLQPILGKRVLKCRMESNKCTFKGLKVKVSNYDWAADDPDLLYMIDILKFQECVLPNVTNVFCFKHPIVQEIDLSSSHVHTVSPDAFSDCVLMTRLFLKHNNIEVIHRNTFQNNKHLRILDLSSNKLTRLHSNIFVQLTSLAILNLTDNDIRRFEPKTIRNMKSLMRLSLFSNDLSEFDLLEFLKHLPKLRSVSIDDNDISCPQMAEFYEVCQEMNINATEVTWVPKNRFHEPMIVANTGQLCDGDVDLMGVHFRKEYKYLYKSVKEFYEWQETILERLERHEERLRAAKEELLSAVAMESC